MRLLVIRHPHPTGGDGLCYGRTDLEVASDLVDRAVERALRLLPVGVNAVVSSPLRRCLVVAERLVDHLAAAGRLVIDDGKSLQQSGANARPGPLADFGLADSRAPGEAVQSAQSAHCEPLAQDPRLTEIDFGQWEGLPWDDIDRDAFDEWVGDYVNRAAPKGESWGDVRSRVATFINEMRVTAGRLDGADHTVVAVTHAGVMRAMASIALAIPLESTWHIHFPFDAFMELEIAADAQYDRLITLR